MSDFMKKKGSSASVQFESECSGLNSSHSMHVYDPDLYPMRSRLQSLLERTTTEYVLAVIILLNLMLLVVETDVDKPDDKTPLWIELINKAMLAFFSIEIGARIYTYRKRILTDPWAIVDILVIALDLIFTLLGEFLSNMPPVSMMRIVRLLRLTRTTKIIKLIPQLHIIVLSLAGASTPLFWGFVMLVLLLLSLGILAVQLINPVIEDIIKNGGFEDCDRCGRSFSTVWHSSLTMIQQVIAGDSWGTVTLPVIEHSPWTIIFFMIVFISLSMALMNIILANVVDAVMQARLANDQYLADLRKKDRKEAKIHLLGICRGLDEDGSGYLSYDEFKGGYEQDADFRVALNAMDIKKEDLETVWGILDEDDSGDVSYNEFCEQLFKLKSSDSHTVLMFIKAYIADVRRQVNDGLKLMKHDIMGGLEGALKMMNKDDEMLQQISKRLNCCSNLFAFDENNSQLESVIHDVLPQETDVSCDPLQLSPAGPEASANQQDVACLLQEQHCIAMGSSLESLCKLENKLESKIAALSDLINTLSRTFSPTLPDSFNESSRCGEHRRTQKDDTWLPFVMCCKGKPASNFTTIIHETSQDMRDNQVGRSLLKVPVGLAKCVTPRVEGNNVKRQA